jgi:hypothetical protein
MADQICRVNCYSVGVPNKAGTGACVLAGLKDASVDLIAFWGYPVGKGKAQLDLVSADAGALGKALRKAKLKVVKKSTAFLLQGEDRAGALGQYLAKVSEVGVNVLAVQAVAAGEGRFGAVLFLDAKDVRKAAKALGA